MTTWTPVSPQSETWTEQAQPIRVFDPNVFDLKPVYDTGSPAGIWQEPTPSVETWT